MNDYKLSDIDMYDVIRNIDDPLSLMVKFAKIVFRMAHQFEYAVVRRQLARLQNKGDINRV